MSDRPARRRARTLLALAAGGLAAAFALAGCAQEGKLIQTPLPVRGVALEFQETHRGLSGDVNVVDTSVVNVRFKILVHAQNACEAGRTVLELRQVGSPPTYEIIPVARYNVDDRCVQQPAGAADTAQALTVTGLLMLGTQTYAFRVPSAGGPDFNLTVDSTVTSSQTNTTLFRVFVRHAATDSAFAGATVAIDTLAAGGVAVPAGSGTTDAAGLFSLNVPFAVPADSPGPAYRVTATAGADQQVFSVPSFRARGGRVEIVYIRL